MGAEYGVTLEFEPAAIPRRLNMVFDVGPEKGNVNLCIYQIAQDIWKMSIARGSVPPPTFASTPGSGFAMEVLQQVATS